MKKTIILIILSLIFVGLFWFCTDSTSSNGDLCTRSCQRNWELCHNDPTYSSYYGEKSDFVENKCKPYCPHSTDAQLQCVLDANSCSEAQACN